MLGRESCLSVKNKTSLYFSYVALILNVVKFTKFFFQSFSVFAATTTLKISCSGGEVEGRYIHIEDNRNRIDYFSLCEIQIFVNKGMFYTLYTYFCN